MRGKIGGKELLEKRRGMSASLCLCKIELTDEAGSGAMPDAAGGGGVTGR